MATANGIRNKLANKVFNTNKLGVSVTVTSITTTTDKWGDASSAGTTSTSVNAVPYNHTSENQNFQPFGTLKENELDMVLPYDTSISTDCTVTYDNEVYDVTMVEKNPFGSQNLVYVVRLQKQL